MRLPAGPRLFRESETGARQKYAGGCPAVTSTPSGVAIDRATIVRFKPGRTSRPPSSTCTIPAAPAPGLLSAASRLNRKPSRGRKEVIPRGGESAQLTQLRPSIVTPHRRRDRLCGARRRAGASAQASAAGDAIAQLVRYLPTELVAAYTTVVGVLPLPGGDPVCNGEFTARWIALAIFVVLTPITLQTSLRRQATRGRTNAVPTVPWFEHGAALVAFLAWSLALPLTPVTSWCDWQPQYGVAIAATALLLLGLAAQLRRPLR